MKTILEQPLSEKHFNFFKTYLQKGKIYSPLAKEILSGRMRARATDVCLADDFMNEILSDKVIVKRLLSIQPSYFYTLPEYLKKEEDIIDIALRYPPNIELLGKTDENYLKILDKCFREAKRYVIRQVGFPNLKSFMTRLYFNVDENEEPTTLKDNVLSLPKLIVPIMKYFTKLYPNIKTKLTKDQLIEMVRLTNPTILQKLNDGYDTTFLKHDAYVEYEYNIKAKYFLTPDIDDALRYEFIMKNPKLSLHTSSILEFLTKDDYQYAKLVLSKLPKLIKILNYDSPYFRGEYLQRLKTEIPNIIPFTKNLRYH